MNNKQHFIEHGWIHLKGFFSPEVIAQMHEGVRKSVEEKIGGDLLCNRHLADLTVLNPNILAVVRDLLGEDPTYIGDSNISFNDLAMSLHKDNPDRFNAQAPDWQSPYTVLRMGIYLQDYTTHSGGLILRDRSHNYVTRWKGKVMNVKTQPGDLVIWNLRTTHSGSARRYKAFPGVDVNPYINKYMPGFLFAPTHTERAALFISYGKDDIHLKRYIDYLKTREYAINKWRAMNITDDLRRRSEQQGLKLKDFTDFARNVSDKELHVEHQEIKF